MELKLRQYNKIWILKYRSKIQNKMNKRDTILNTYLKF